MGQNNTNKIPLACWVFFWTFKFVLAYNGNIDFSEASEKKAWHSKPVHRIFWTCAEEIFKEANTEGQKKRGSDL